MGVSFAIPINVAMDIAQQLRSEGRVRRGRLGIGIQEMSSELAESFGLKEPRGAIVTSVERDSPAAQAGLAAGDVVLGIDGKPIDGATDLPRLVASHKPGSRVTLDVARGGERRSVTATLAEAPTPRTETRRARTPDNAGHQGMSRLGIAVSELPPAGRRALGVDYGLVVEGVEGDNADSPLRRGDVIVGVGAERFRSLDEFHRRLREARAGSRVALLVRRGEATLYVPVTVGAG
jgi:serine protease Do